jgi:hypothetical protein
MKVIVTENLYPKLGIVNGSINYIKKYQSQVLNGLKKIK